MPAFLNNSKVQIVFYEVPLVDEVINLTETSLGLNLNTIFKETRTGSGQTKIPTYVPENGLVLDSWIGYISENYKTSFLSDYVDVPSNFSLFSTNDFQGSGIGTVTIFANFDNAVFVLQPGSTTAAEITITNKIAGSSSTPTSGGNIINLTWDGATDDNGISGYQLQWTTSTAAPWSPIISVPHDPTYGLNTTTSGGGFYNHSATQLVDHIFRIRIVDSSGQYSGYKYITAGVNTDVILISNNYTTSASLACSVHPLVPINPILLNPLSSLNLITPNATYVKQTDNSIFHGYDKYWRILLSGVEYGCKVDPDGLVTEVTACSTIPNTLSYNTALISSGLTLTSVVTSGPVCNLNPSTSVFFSGTLGIGTIIYRQVDDAGVLSDPLPGGNKYYILGSSIVKISSSPPGKVLSIQDYSTTCPPPPIDTCCFVKGTKISMSDNTIKNIEDVKIGDIVITYNEETKLQEPGEVIGIASPLKSNIVEYKLSNDIIIKSTTCHPYWAVNKGWSSFNPLLTKELYDFDVEQIEESDILLTIDNKEVIVDKITELITKKVMTYNLKILGNHTYYANGILVHNKDEITQIACFAAQP
jgi:hypothetical protein